MSLGLTLEKLFLKVVTNIFTIKQLDTAFQSYLSNRKFRKNDLRFQIFRLFSIQIQKRILL